MNSHFVFGELSVVGRVEVSSGSGWGSICNIGWDDADASAVCMDLGFKAGWAATLSSYNLPPGQAPFLYQGVQCDPQQTNLTGCCAYPANPQQCTSHEQDAAVYCSVEGAVYA